MGRPLHRHHEQIKEGTTRVIAEEPDRLSRSVGRKRAKVASAPTFENHFGSRSYVNVLQFHRASQLRLKWDLQRLQLKLGHPGVLLEMHFS